MRRLASVHGKLLPCPDCGAAPYTEYDPVHREYGVGCANDDCSSKRGFWRLYLAVAIRDWHSPSRISFWCDREWES